MTHDTSLSDHCQALAQQAREASKVLLGVSSEQINQALFTIADSIEKTAEQIQSQNKLDLEAGKEAGLSQAMLDRLALDQPRIASIAQAVRDVAEQPAPVGTTLEGRTLDNGLHLEKRRVPIGSILMIFESRPNVTTDAAALCLKSGNAVILRGGKEARHSNQALADAVRAGLQHAKLPENAVQLVETTDRQAVSELLQLDELIDVCIPRGGESLIRAVVEQSRIPVIKHYTGNCHVYVHEDAQPDMARAICVNAKTHRTGVCNATETILLNKATLDNGLALSILQALAEKGVEIRGDQKIQSILPDAVPATQEDYATEFLDLIVAVKVVDSLDEAIDHINQFGSRHTDAIITQSLAASQQFTQLVDTANAMINCSTRFSDGGEYGLGAEIGISTDKLHARGPMGAMDLTTYKWIVTGQGHTRH